MIVFVRRPAGAAVFKGTADAATAKQAVLDAQAKVALATTQATNAANSATAAAGSAAKAAAFNAPFALWTGLAAATGMAAGDKATVLASDGGTHTDPVAGGTVANAGVYQYSSSPAGWQRVGDLDSQTAASSASAAAASATAYPDVAAALGPDLLSGITSSTVGSTTPNTNTAATGVAQGNDVLAPANSILQTVSVRLSATGTGNIEIVAPVNGIQTIVTVIPVTVTTIPQTFTMPANTVLPKNGRVFYRRLTGGTIRYISAGSPTAANYTDADAADGQVTVNSNPASTVAISYTARAASKTLADRVTTNETFTSALKTYKYGTGLPTTPASATGTLAGNRTYLFALPTARTGFLRVQVFGGSTGETILVKRFTRSGGTFTQIGSDIPVTIAANVLSTVETGVVVNAGEYLGFYAALSTSVGWNSADPAPSGGRYSATGNVATVTGGRVTTGAMQVKFDIASAQPVVDVDSRLGSVEDVTYQTVAGNPNPLGTGAGGSIAANTFAYYNPIAKGGRLRVRVRGGPGYSGSIPIRRFSRSGDTYTQIGSDIWVPVIQGQITTYDTGVIVNAGEFMGFSGLGLAGMVAYTPGVTYSGGWVVGTGDVTSFTDSTPDNTGTFEIGFDVPGQTASGGSNVFAGALLVCLGDSMTMAKGYPGVIASRLGLTVTECGMGGTQLTYDPVGDTDRCAFSIVKIAQAIASGDWSAMTAAASSQNIYQDIVARLAGIDWTQVNYLTIFSGTNDYGAGQRPLGLTSSTTQSEFNGAWNYIIPTILAAHPQIKLVALTPTYRSRFAAGDGHDSDTYANSQGLVLPQYADATVERARARHIPVLDLNRVSGINASTAAFYLSDGLHQNPLYGDPLLGGKIASFLAASF